MCRSMMIKHLLLVSISLLLLVFSSQAMEHVVPSASTQTRRFLQATPTCASQLSTCQATSRGTSVPYKQWSDMLSRIDDGQNTVVTSIRETVDRMSVVEFTEETVPQLTLRSDMTDSERDELEEMVDLLETEMMTAHEGESEITLNQVQTVLTVFLQVLGFFGVDLGVDSNILRDLAKIVDDVLSAQADGALYVWGTIAAAVVNYAVPLFLNIFQSPTDPAVCAEAMNCQYDQMVTKVIPAMVEGLFIATGHEVAA